MAGATLDLLTKPELLLKAKEEYTVKMQGRKYRCAIPDDVEPPLGTARATAEKLKGS
jgi:hypothetical protein